MASSLASQLKGIRSLNASRLASASSLNAHASYLFPAQTAARQDLDTVFALGETGWAELCSQDASLEKWRDGAFLFGPESKAKDRTMLTRQENSKLDAVIEEFFDRIGAVLLSKSTGKCLEWLVRRYRIQDFNALTTLRAFLPYHYSPHFARMLHILDISSEAHLRFLLPLKKTAQPLPLSILLSALLSPPSTTPSLDNLRLVSTIVKTGQRPHRSQLLFWSSTLVQFCHAFASSNGAGHSAMGLAKSSKKARGHANEQVRADNAQLVLGVLLPAVVSIVNDGHVGLEGRLAGCLILCAVGANFRLSPEAIHSTVAAIFAPFGHPKVDQQLVQAILLSSAALFRGLPSEPSRCLDAVALRQALRISDIGVQLKLLSAKFDVQPFVTALLHGLEPILTESGASALMANLLCNVSAPGGVPTSIVRKVLHKITKGREIDSATAHVLLEVRSRRTAAFDDFLRSLSQPNSACNDETLAASVIKAVLDQQTRGMNRPDAYEECLWLAVNAAEASERAVALRSLFAAIHAGRIQMLDSFVRETFLARLLDDNLEVINVLYGSEAKPILLDSLSTEDILQQLEVACGPKSILPASVLSAHLSFLFGTYLPQNPKTSNRIFRNILWSRLLWTKDTASHSEATRKAIVAHLSSDSSAQPLQELAFRLGGLSATPATDVNSAIVDAVAHGLASVDGESHLNTHISFILTQSKKSDAVFASKALALLVCSALLSKIPDTRFSMLATRILEIHGTPLEIQRDTKWQVWDDVEKSLSGTLEIMRAQILISTAKNLRLGVTGQGNPLVGLGSSPSDTVSKSLGLARQLYTIAVSSDGTELLSALFTRLDDNVLPFLCSLATTIFDNHTVASHAVRSVRACLEAYRQDARSHQSDFQVLIPALLIVLMHENITTRSEALLTIEVLTSLAKKASLQAKEVLIWGYDIIYGSTSDTLMYIDISATYRFASDLLDQKDSLVNDSGYLPALLGSMLSLNKGQDKFESAYRRSVTAYLGSHLISWPSFSAKSSLLTAMSRIRDSGKIVAMLPLIQDVVAAAESSSLAFLLRDLPPQGREIYLERLFELFDKRAKGALEQSDCAAWKLLLRASQSGEALIVKYTVPAFKRMWSFLDQERRNAVIEALVGALVAPAIKAPAEVKQTLQTLDLDVSTLVSVCSKLRLGLASQNLDVPAAKKSRSEDTRKDVVTRSAAMAGEILEVVLQAPGLSTAPLVAELFEMLRVFVELHLSRTFNADYLLHLALSSLSKALTGVMPTTDIIQSLRVDTVVNVIKTSKNPSTFQQALLLLSSIATLAPEIVLHSAMPIFTFVGSSVLQRDDTYSFTVVERVLRSIVPPLVVSLNRQLNTAVGRQTRAARHFDLIRLSRPFLRIFTDSATHIPRHRRQTFFQLLVEVLGPIDFAAPVIMLLVDRSAHKINRQERQHSAMGEFVGEHRSQTLQLSLAVLAGQATHVQLRATVQIWDEIERLWNTRSSVPTETGQLVFLDRLGRVVREHADHQADAGVQVVALLAMLRAAVSSLHFKIKSSRTGADLNPSVEDAALDYDTFIGAALRMMDVSDKSIAAGAREALASIMPLVPMMTFMKIAKSLVEHEAEAMRISGFSLVASRLALLHAHEREQVATTTWEILAAIRIALASSATRGAALSALRSLVISPAKSEDAGLSLTLPSTLDVIESQTSNLTDKKMALGIVRALAHTLGPRLLVHLQRIVGVCVTLPENAKSGLRRLSLETLNNLFASIPTFMEAHLRAVVSMVTNQKVHERLFKGSSTDRSLDALLTTLIKRMPGDKTLESVFVLWNAVNLNVAHRVGVLHFLQRFLRQADRTVFGAQYKSIFRFILGILDERRTNTALQVDDIGMIEDLAVQCFVKLVLKLNETTFRPLFLRIYDWAALDLAEDDMPPSNAGLVARRIALYKVNNALHDQLKSLISHYYATMLDLTIELLAAFKTGELSNAQLWTAIVTSVDKSAQWDEGTFWNPVRLQKLAPVFVGQLDCRNVQLLEEVEGLQAVRAALIPAFVHLAGTVPDEGSLKVLNGSLLDQLRIDDAAVRVSALQVLTAVWSEPSLSSVLLGLVPETVPHIAELMEMDESEVSDATKAFIRGVEKVLGESLDSYLQ